MNQLLYRSAFYFCCLLSQCRELLHFRRTSLLLLQVPLIKLQVQRHKKNEKKKKKKIGASWTGSRDQRTLSSLWKGEGSIATNSSSAAVRTTSTHFSMDTSKSL